jgi:hypothetical protein
MGPRKKKTAKDNKKKNLKIHPQKTLFLTGHHQGFSQVKYLKRSHLLQQAVIYPDYIYCKENLEEL